MQNLSIKGKIAESLIDIYSDSTIHGIPRVIKSKRVPSKIIWAICFLASTGYCSYLIINAINNFLNYDTVTNVDIFYEMPAQFPFIQICNLNMFQTNRAKDYLTEFFNNYSSIFSNLTKFQIYDGLLWNQISLSEKAFQESLSFPLDEILISCVFNTNDCDANDFTRVFDRNHGNCYRFNSGVGSDGNSKEIFNITRGDTSYGLQLELYVASSNYARDLIINNGYVVGIGNQSIKSNQIMNEVYVSSGFYTDIAIERHFEYRLDDPFNDCISNLDSIDSFDSDLFKSFIDSNFTYDQTDCFDGCFQKIVIQKCNCLLKPLGHLSFDVSCLTPEQLLCCSGEWEKFINSNILERCEPDCPARCDSIRYSKTISTSDYPSRGYFESTLANHSVIKTKFKNKSITYENLKSNVLAINIYYSKLMYTVTSQQPKTTVIDLVSNIGGLLGLFIGLSFLSLVELIEAFFELIFIFFTTSKD